ncbi:MAG TPA: CCA tRNA nucleotidyltransferase [Candidatus Eisenbacteria bacterium]|nr:CCA tRNA nucleotidyltransferase [Candidatus Eisenbacteria bacterium]
MENSIPDNVLSVYHTLQKAGYEVYFVGGCVRDMLLKKSVKDWDLTTNATPEEILKVFPDGFYDNTFGTVGVPVEISNFKSQISNKDARGVARDGEPQNLSGTNEMSEAGLGAGERQDPLKQIVEITTYRTERNYTDSRHPGEVAWGKTIEEDLQRRDFTVNAMAMQLQITNSNSQETNNIPNTKYQILNTGIVDPYNGKKDLEDKIIRAVGNPNERFKEDALRLMRAIRFATQLSFTIEDATWKAIQEDAQLLPLISGERIRDELLKILSSEYPYEGIMLLKNANLLQHILPELLEGIGISQERPGRHHTADVFTHNVLSLKFTPSTDPIVRFATLIHDIGKPRVESKDENGLVIFYNHEISGASIAYEICERLKFSKKDRKKVVTLIRWHMFTVDEHITDSAVRRFIRRIGVDNVKDMVDLRIGDRLGSGTQTAESWRLKLFKDRIEKELAPGPFSINDLAIDGNDIMKELGLKPGRQVGQLLQKLFEEVDENLELNTKNYLFKRVKELYEQYN